MKYIYDKSDVKAVLSASGTDIFDHSPLVNHEAKFSDGSSYKEFFFQATKEGGLIETDPTVKSTFKSFFPVWLECLKMIAGRHNDAVKAELINLKPNSRKAHNVIVKRHYKAMKAELKRVDTEFAAWL